MAPVLILLGYIRSSSALRIAINWSGVKVASPQRIGGRAHRRLRWVMLDYRLFGQILYFQRLIYWRFKTPTGACSAVSFKSASAGP